MIRIEPKEPYKGLKRTPMKQKPPKVSWLTKNPPKLRKTAKTKTPKVSWLSRKPLKSMSKKMQKQRREEDKLSLRLAELSGNHCEICGVYKPPMGLRNTKS